MLKERSDVKRCAHHRPLAPEEEVVRLVCSWDTEEGYVGKIFLKTRDEVRMEQTNLQHKYLNEEHAAPVICALAPSCGCPEQVSID